MSDTVTISIDLKSNDFGKLAKVYALLASENLKASVSTGAGSGVGTVAAAAPAVRRGPGRPPKVQAAAVPGDAPVAKRGPGRPRKIQPDAAAAGANSANLEEKFSKWHAGQRKANGRGKYFTAAENHLLMPRWDAAFDAYRSAAGAAAEGARSTKSWSITRLRREAEALGGGGRENKEGSPVLPAAPAKRRGRPPGKGKGKATGKTRPDGKPPRLKSRIKLKAKA